MSCILMSEWVSSLCSEYYHDSRNRSVSECFSSSDKSTRNRSDKLALTGYRRESFVINTVVMLGKEGLEVIISKCKRSTQPIWEWDKYDNGESPSWQRWCRWPKEVQNNHEYHRLLPGKHKIWMAGLNKFKCTSDTGQIGVTGKKLFCTEMSLLDVTFSLRDHKILFNGKNPSENLKFSEVPCGNMIHVQVWVWARSSSI